MTTSISRDTAILATDSMPLAVGLSALITSIPPIRRIQRVSDLDDLLMNLTLAQPVLIILDTSLLGVRTIEVLGDIHERAPDSIRILLSDTMSEIRDLIFASQDTIIMKGTDPARLARIIEYLLSTSVVA